MEIVEIRCDDFHKFKVLYQWWREMKDIKEKFFFLYTILPGVS